MKRFLKFIAVATPLLWIFIWMPGFNCVMMSKGYNHIELLAPIVPSVLMAILLYTCFEEQS